MSRLSPPARDKSGYLSEDTIAAVATALGGAIAVIRVSGPESFPALDRLCSSASVRTPPSTLEPRKLHRIRLQSSDGSPIDDALFARFIGPESYTGEDVVEFNVHGSAYIASRLLETLHEFGVRQALPGEFSFRAVRNGKLSMTQATAVADLIAASNAGAVALAIEKLSGTQNRLISGLAKDLRTLAMLGEAGIDFSDQDLDEVSIPALRKRVTPLLTSLERLKTSYQRGVLLQDGIGVAFVGLPNAGKSSFFNALLGEDRSIVSEIPGTTRDVVRERITLEGNRGSFTLRLEDTAGLRSTNNRIEEMGIQRSHKSARDADLVLLLVDPTASLDEAIQQWRALSCSPQRSIGILTKSDLMSDSQLKISVDACQNSFEIPTWITTSAINGAGIPEAIDAITSFCESLVHREKEEVLLTRLDQLGAVSAAMEHLNRACQAPEIELFVSDVRQALHALAPLIGETTADDVLSMIFSQFCIGK